MFKKTVSWAMLALLFLGILLSSTPITAQGRVLKILDAATGLNTITFGNATTPMPSGGYNFTVDVFLYGATDNLAAYQVYITFNNTILTCTAAWIPDDNQSFVFYGKMIVPVSDIRNSESYAIAGAVSFTIVNVAESALLCKFNFTARRIGSTQIQLQTGESQTGESTSILLDADNQEISFTTESFNVTVLASSTPPVASFSISPTAPKANQTILFDASGSYDPDGGDIATYRWDFDDYNVTTVNTSSIRHTYTHNGLYSVNLTVTDDEDSTTSVVKDVPVGTSPVAAFTFTPATVQINQTVTFNATGSSDADGTIVSYRWDFGDGNITTVGTSIITHAYSSKGLMDVHLTVTDNDGLYNSIMKEAMIGAPPVPNLYFKENPSSNEEVVFNASLSHDPDGNVTEYIWEFGDELFGTPPTETNQSTITHTYIGADVYTVNLTVVDNDGLYASVVGYLSVEHTQSATSKISIILEGVDYRVMISSNSTITHFNFNPLQTQIGFNVTGPSDTVGFCNVTIPKALLKAEPIENWAVTVDHSSLLSILITGNATHSFIYFTYTHASTLQVTIQGTWVVPEFPSAMIMSLFIVLSMLAIVIAKRKIPKKTKT